MNIRAEREAKKTMSHKRPTSSVAPPQQSWQDVVMVTFSRVRARQLQEQVGIQTEIRSLISRTLWPDSYPRSGGSTEVPNAREFP